MRPALLLVLLALLATLLVLPTGGASCHYCINGPEPVEEVTRFLSRYLP